MEIITSFSKFLQVAQYAKDTKNIFSQFQTVDESDFFTGGFFDAFKNKLNSYSNLTELEKKIIYKDSLKNAIFLY